MAYASKTSVPVGRSREEIQKILSKYKATAFAFAETKDVTQMMFEMSDRRIRFTLPMPQISKNPTAASMKTYDQLCRSKWRALLLVIKAKLEAVESGITTLEQEFLAHIVLPNGKTVGEETIPQIGTYYQTGKMPPLLGARP